MRVFISWSGKLSHEFAVILDNWLQCIIPNIETFLSSRSIEPGTRWSKKVSEELQTCNAGIICLSSENIMSPWINFEAGALSKYIDSSKVIPILINIENNEISKSPLSQFQTLSTKKEDISKLLTSLFEIMQIKNSKTSLIFEKWWEEFEIKINKLELPIKTDNHEGKYESLLQDFNKLNEGVKTQIHQFKDVLADLTSTREFISSENDAFYSNLIGLWKNPKTGTNYFGIIIENDFYLPYIYNGNPNNLAHYHSIKIIGKRIYGRFKWFYQDISGYFYLDILSSTKLVGEWFYSHEVAFEKIEDINEYQKEGKTITMIKSQKAKEPFWLKNYVDKKLYKIIF